MKKEVLSNGLEILKPEEGYLLYKKNDDPITYHKLVYLAKMETESDYAEVTNDYVYGKNYDEKIENLNNIIEKQQKQLDNYGTIISSQSDVIDYLLFSNSDFDKDMNLFDSKLNGVNPLAVYLARRIMDNKLSYSLVMSKFADIKNDIDLILIQEDRVDLIEDV